MDPPLSSPLVLPPIDTTQLVLEPNLKSNLHLTEQDAFALTVAMIGDQQHGKSTIASTLTGYPFPTGDGERMVTVGAVTCRTPVSWLPDGCELALTDSEGPCSADRRWKYCQNIPGIDLQKAGLLGKEFSYKNLSLLFATQRVVIFVYQSFHTALDRLTDLCNIIIEKNLLSENLQQERHLILLHNKAEEVTMRRFLSAREPGKQPFEMETIQQCPSISTIFSSLHWHCIPHLGPNPTGTALHPHIAPLKEKLVSFSSQPARINAVLDWLNSLQRSARALNEDSVIECLVTCARQSKIRYLTELEKDVRRRFSEGFSLKRPMSPQTFEAKLAETMAYLKKTAVAIDHDLVAQFMTTLNTNLISDFNNKYRQCQEHVANCLHEGGCALAVAHNEGLQPHDCCQDRTSVCVSNPPFVCPSSRVTPCNQYSTFNCGSCHKLCSTHRVLPCTNDEPGHVVHRGPCCCPFSCEIHQKPCVKEGQHNLSSCICLQCCRRGSNQCNSCNQPGRHCKLNSGHSGSCSCGLPYQHNCGTCSQKISVTCPNPVPSHTWNPLCKVCNRPSPPVPCGSYHPSLGCGNSVSSFCPDCHQAHTVQCGKGLLNFHAACSTFFFLLLKKLNFSGNLDRAFSTPTMR